MPDAPELWFHNINRAMLQSGELKNLAEQFGLAGFATDPALLERAVGEGTAYDDAICEATEADPVRIFDALLIEDIQAATDALHVVYEQTGKAAGYVSFDLPPLDSPVMRLAEARRVFAAVNRPNVMVKLPGKLTDLTVIEEALYAGVNVHVTMVYSIQNYVSLAQGYISALERRLFAGLPVDNIVSVVGFGLSSVDQVVNRHLQNSIRAAQSRADFTRVTANDILLGKVAIANARTTYRRFRDLFYGDRFANLRAAGARPQKLLWTDLNSTSAASPLTYLDAMRATERDSAFSVNHGVLAALKARHETGEHPPAPDGDNPIDILNRLDDVGVDLDRIGRQLQSDHEEAHAESYRRLFMRVEGKRDLLVSGFMGRQRMILGIHREAVESELQRLRALKVITRTWAHDPAIWTDDEAHAEIIRARLGWLTIANDERIDRAALRDLRHQAHTAVWAHVVLLGMGGASLSAEVLFRVFGQQAGYPGLIVLDTTHPAAITDVERAIDLRRTVFITASKTGTTLETLCLMRYFYDKAGDGSRFIAITDPGSPLEAEARDKNFQHIFLNPADIGGRYSALTYFGMVPAALCGLDFEKIMDRAAEMQAANSPNVMGLNHPGLWLGTVLGVLAKPEHRRDKVTIFTTPELAGFGDWAEQLIAESTGKNGRGIVPISGATVGLPHDYDDDRIFVHLRIAESPDHTLPDGTPDRDREEELDRGMLALQQAGHPVVTLELRDQYDIGAEFFRWQFAASTVGMISRVNPFDEPNVAESKTNTARLLEIYQRTQALPALHNPAVIEDEVALYADEPLTLILNELCDQHDYEATPLEGMVAAFLGMARSGEYIAIQAYLPPRPEYADILGYLRRRVRHTFRRAVMVNFGPRYLHATGQLHKGGPNNAVFVQLTMAEAHDLPVPGAAYSFGTLKQAQAQGDYEALRARGRRVIRLHFSADALRGLQKLSRAIEAAAAKRR
jgi:transaldolase/glucose-6-phosphate isomerase